MTTRVEDVMTIDVVAIGEQAPFKESVEIMRRHKAGRLLVIDAVTRWLVGMSAGPTC